jgi:ABC-type multidrug transport system fused ATPase/permease subunit
MPAAPSPRRFAAALLRPHRLALLLAAGAVLLQALIALPIPVVQGRLLDRLLAGASPAELAGPFQTAAAVTAGCLLARAVLGWRAGVVMTRVSLEVVRGLTAALHRKVRRLPLAALDRHPTGGLMARLTADVGTVMIFLNAGTLQLASDLVLAAGVAGVLVWLSPPLALVALAAVPLAAVGHAGFAGPLRRRSGDARAALADLYALLAERLPALRVARAFNQEAAELARLDARLDAHAAAAVRGLRAGAAQAAVAAAAGGLGTAAVVAAGAGLAAAGRLSPGDLLTFYALTALLYAPAVRLAQFQAGWAAVRVAADRMGELLAEPDPPAGAVAAPRAGVRGALEARGLTFRHRPDAAPALDGIDLRVGPGGTLGVVGPTGAGKSTLLAVLANLYDPGPGRVFLDGTDVAACRPEDLRRAVVLVPQRPALFAGTVRSNLAYAAPDGSDFRLWRALEAVELAGVVRDRPGGLDAPLGPGGAGLSGGQRQRLALARAVLADPAVLLLDDCTSALDPVTAAKVRANLAAHLPGVTRVVVSHDPDAVRSADEILVLDGGRVAERGTRDGLLARGGRYAVLARLCRPPDPAG